MSGGQTWVRAGTEARSKRAQLKRRIMDGDVDLPALLEGAGAEHDEEVAIDAPLVQLLLAIPGIGDQALQRILEDAGVIALKGTRLGTLTTGRRRALAAAIRRENTR